MAKKKGIVSSKVAEQRAIDARRKVLMRKAKRGDQAAAAELASGAERRTSFWSRILG